MNENIKIKENITTIAAIATPIAMGGVSMIRVSGEKAFEISKSVFSPISSKSLEKMKGYTATYGEFINADGERIDDGIATVFHAPLSYTGENIVELSCHGGIFITREILRLLLDNGAKIAGAGEFSKRAFLNGKMTLTQAEAVMDIINSQSTQALRCAKSQMDGALYKKINGVKQILLEMAGHLAAWVDYPEDDIVEIEEEALLKSLEGARDVTQKLIETFDVGKIIRDGVETAIIGKPNVGKSTLMNLLAGCEKSIVTDIAGTTRDIVEERVNLGNVVLRLADTAGIHETQDKIEKYGVELALKRIKIAQLVLVVFDYSSCLSKEDEKIIEELSKENIPIISIISKTDLKKELDTDYIISKFKHVVYCSVENPDSLQELADKIENILSITSIDTTSGIIANERQRSCALTALENLNEGIIGLKTGVTLDAVTISVEYALSSLLELTGEKATEVVVEQVFHNFCVGK